MNTNIEPGCLCMVIKSKAGNEGLVVTVGSFIGKVEGWVGSERWETDRPLKGFMEG